MVGGDNQDTTQLMTHDLDRNPSPAPRSGPPAYLHQISESRRDFDLCRSLLTMGAFPRLALAISLAINLLGQPGDPAARHAPTVSLDVSYVTAPNGARQLHITVTNHSDHPLDVVHGWLPWESRLPLTLIAVEAESGEVLSSPLLIDDPTPGVQRIGVGQAVDGFLALEPRLPSLPLSLSRGPVLLFWSYQVRTRDGLRGERLFGGLILPCEPARNRR